MSNRLYEFLEHLYSIYYLLRCIENGCNRIREKQEKQLLCLLKRVFQSEFSMELESKTQLKPSGWGLVKRAVNVSTILKQLQSDTKEEDEEDRDSVKADFLKRFASVTGLQGDQSNEIPTVQRPTAIPDGRKFSTDKFSGSSVSSALKVREHRNRQLTWKISDSYEIKFYPSSFIIQPFGKNFGVIL